MLLLLLLLLLLLVVVVVLLLPLPPLLLPPLLLHRLAEAVDARVRALRERVHLAVAAVLAVVDPCFNETGRARDATP